MCAIKVYLWSLKQDAGYDLGGKTKMTIIGNFRDFLQVSHLIQAYPLLSNIRSGCNLTQLWFSIRNCNIKARDGRLASPCDSDEYKQCWLMCLHFPRCVSST